MGLKFELLSFFKDGKKVKRINVILSWSILIEKKNAEYDATNRFYIYLLAFGGM